MSRVDDDEARTFPRRPYLRWAALCALILVAAIFAWWQTGPSPTEVTTDAALGAASGSGGAWMGLLLSAAIAGGFGWLLVRLQARATRARNLGAQLAALSDLLDVWQWRTDAQHRLVHARPPHDAPPAEWTLGAAPQPLWSCFRPGNVAVLEARMKSGASLHDVEVRREAADGSVRMGRLRGRALVDANGAFAGYIGTVREDMAEAGAAGAPASTAFGPVASEPGALADSEAERESFSYTVSHDLRAPIRVVEGFTKIVKEDYGSVLDRVGHDHLDRVLGAAARMNSMIDALLALSRLSTQPLARQPVNLSQLAGFVADDLRRLWPDREITFEVMPEMHVLGDPTLLRVVLENLLGNAWKYSAGRKPARIVFERSTTEPATYTVRDNGAGFDMRFADRLFGVFQRLHSASDFPGTGVGLASVRRIVRRHGGEIWAESEPDKGAAFHFTLPQGDGRR
jgi:signal transduction histidine kinase